MAVQPKRLNERLRCHVTPTNTIGVNNDTKQINYPTSLHYLIQMRDLVQIPLHVLLYVDHYYYSVTHLNMFVLL